MYINFWYPVCLSEELKEEPLKVTILGLDFVAFRDSNGEAHCLSDICVHRGGSLSGGLCHTEDNTIACPYHGWRFDKTGKCIRIPSLGLKGKIPPRAKVDSYPVTEKYDIIFAFLGDLPEEERSPLYEIEEYGKDGWRANKTVTLDLNYNYERSIENALDPAHNEFIHPTHGFEGSKNDYQVNPSKITETAWGANFEQLFDAPPLDQEIYGETAREESGELTVYGGYHGPNVVITQIHTKKEINWFHQYFFEQPISQFKTKIFFVNMRNWILEEKWDEMVMERNLIIAGEDITVMTDLRPQITPDTMTKEVLVPADLIMGQYRKTMKGWESKGYKIDSETLDKNKHKMAFSIPCPARKQEKNWVLDSIPLINGK